MASVELGGQEGKGGGARPVLKSLTDHCKDFGFYSNNNSQKNNECRSEH